VLVRPDLPRVGMEEVACGRCINCNEHYEELAGSWVAGWRLASSTVVSLLNSLLCWCLRFPLHLTAVP